ncbi:hypothetical protein D3C85_1472240 [compost metagenome]
MDMRVDAASCYDFTLTRNNLGTCTYDHIRMHAIHNIRVACFANANNMTLTNTDIAFDNTPVINNDSIRY